VRFAGASDVSAERALAPDERPTVPAPASDAERSFEEEVARLSGGHGWSGKFRVSKQRKEGLPR